MSDAILTQGTVIRIGDGGSPEVFSDIAEATGFDMPGADPTEIDVTHLGSVAKEYKLGLPDFGRMTFTVNWIPDDATHVTLKTLARATTKTATNFRIVLSDGTIWQFTAYVYTQAIGAAPDDVLRSTITLRITGAVTDV